MTLRPRGHAVLSRPAILGSETDYGHDLFKRDEFEEKAEVLKALRGSFILSLNDRPEVRKCFAAFKIEAVEVPYTITKKGTAKARDVIISSVARCND